MNETAYVYVISRLDLPYNHLTVQAAHAAIAATFAFGEHKQTHPHLVVCAVQNERELEESFERLKTAGVPCCAYREDDMDDSLTAIATAPLRGKQRKPLKRFKLLR